VMQRDDIPRTVRALATAYRRHELSPVDVTRSLLEQAEASQETINAFIAITGDRALTQARDAEQRLMRGDASPLLGVPITLKDLYDQAGVSTTAGMSSLRDAVVSADAASVRRLFRAGAVSLGKTNMHECAFGITSTNPHYGPVHNPWNTARIPGGSSGGAGAAVVAGLGPVGMGSDTGGSIRIPAALCGLVGLKPTYGRADKSGVFPLSDTLDHVGPLSQTVADTAYVMDVIAGPGSRDPSSAWRPVERLVRALGRLMHGVRVGVIAEQQHGVHPDVSTAMDQAIRVIERLGAVVTVVSMPELDALRPAFSTIIYSEAATVHRRSITETPGAYSADVRGRLQEGLAIPAVQYVEAYALLRKTRARVGAWFTDVDLLVGPTVPIPAPTIGTSTISVDGVEAELRSQMTRFTAPYNFTGLPAISVPCGFSQDGMPLGMQLAARPWAEALLVSMAHAYEQATDWHLRYPPLA